MRISERVPIKCSIEPGYPSEALKHQVQCLAPDAIPKILACLGLPTRPLPIEQPHADFSVDAQLLGDTVQKLASCPGIALRNTTTVK